MNEYLTKDVFEVWAQNFDRRLDEALVLREKVDEHSEEIAVMADRSERTEKAARNSKGVSGVISAVISGAISAFMNWGK